MTAARGTSLYDLMDAAYDAAEIRAHSEALGHVPIIDVNPRNHSAALKQQLKQEAKARHTAMRTPRRCATGSGPRWSASTVD